MPTMYDYACQFCGVTFQSRRAPHDKHSPNYCSKGCADNARRRHLIKPCAICGKEFFPTYEGRKFCSQECKYEAHKRRAIVNCAVCGKPFRRNHATRLYCSQRCYGNSMLGVQTRKGKEFTRAVRRAIKERDQYKCVICGSTKRLEIDHIIPASLGGDNSISNGQILCFNCHLEKTLDQRQLTHSHAIT